MDAWLCSRGSDWRMTKKRLIRQGSAVGGSRGYGRTCLLPPPRPSGAGYRLRPRLVAALPDHQGCIGRGGPTTPKAVSGGYSYVTKASFTMRPPPGDSSPARGLQIGRAHV